MCKNTSLVSIIVPIYNVESYLIDCLESIEAQTYDNIECILVVDGQPTIHSVLQRNIAILIFDSRCSTKKMPGRGQQETKVLHCRRANLSALLILMTGLNPIM